ncbi:single-stranded-DNA-specific exonuclease RecJ [Sulfurirhabdus autotrophica]|uniref:Single-stranded-DNA-specific exonuclease RecJ n=1 Tax=Sulfurirhabdus autotrophica TaxID=1706046 RepID=A0A4R3YEP5_9PROT|nr:single-stranded-DNA-specific exonuclease RecJ [Sulfurirhabdus autotrophica]TCV90411.1 single-stranded-DNA-specific exonuclease [Sulfurirhabdus autotrophica]
MPKISTRNYSSETAKELTQQGLHPVLARIFSARGIISSTQLESDLSGLIPPKQLTNTEKMASLLADAIEQKKRLIIIADYDSDGATACAVAIRALREFGAIVDYIVPNRFEYGYGLTPEIVQLAATKQPDILITVDNGIASVAGVAEANRLGMEVLVTDHHLPGNELPKAACIVNPNQPGCPFPSKNLAGVGVIFYVMLALRVELRNRGVFENKQEPNLGNILDLVALGTVADVVKLDDNNRILVQQGLKRIRSGKAHAGIKALYRVSGRDFRKASTYDLGFMLGPRLNAAGRLDDMALGIECLITDNEFRALEIAQRLDTLNRERREIEADMQLSALAVLDTMVVEDSYSLSLYDPEWHQGVIGILASRIKEKFHRPVITFAPGNDGEIKGSGRSVAGLHLRDALDLVSKRHPDLIRKFGGHAFAAGLTIMASSFDMFTQAFEKVARELLSPNDLERIIETDGNLLPDEMTMELATLIENHVWGQGFPQPTFQDEFIVEQQRLVGEKHMKLRLNNGKRSFEAIQFFRESPVPDKIQAAFQLSINEYNGSRTLQLMVQHCEPSE